MKLRITAMCKTDSRPLTSSEFEKASRAACVTQAMLVRATYGRARCEMRHRCRSLCTRAFRFIFLCEICGYIKMCSLIPPHSSLCRRCCEEFVLFRCGRAVCTGIRCVRHSSPVLSNCVKQLFASKCIWVINVLTTSTTIKAS